MNAESLHLLKYPIGKYQPTQTPSPAVFEDWIATLEHLPATVRSLTSGLTARELEFRYRPDGWTIQQVVHHLADSHMNCLIRFKLALTEDAPTIKPYMEDRWANQTDEIDEPIESSLLILQGVHSRLVRLLRSLGPEELKRTFVHPEHGKSFTLVETIGLYAWHCRHHTAHIRQALENKGTFM